MIKKATLTGGIVVLLLATSFFPVSADTNPTPSVEVQERTFLDQFMNDVEQIASESHTFNEFYEKIKDLCLSNKYTSFPVVQECLNKVLSYLGRTQIFSLDGLDFQELLSRLTPNARPDFFVISYGAYHRLNPLKENSINRFKERLSMWRYSDSSMLLKGRTLILQRHPFEIHQKMIGPQLGFMKGFKGIYLDIESKLTGNSYVFFIGHAHRIHVFDLNPLKK